MVTSVGILGSGGHADEVTDCLKDLGIKVQFCAVNKEYLTGMKDCIDIVRPPAAYESSCVIAATGSPLLRKKLVESWKNGKFLTVISPESKVSSSAVIGEGSYIASMAFVSTNTQIGMHSIVNVAATISHGTSIGDFVTVCPGVNIGGGVSIGDGVFIGIGAVIKNKITIAEGCVIGTGATVIHDISEKNAVVVGNPAKVMKINERWLDEIK
jgi:sugar O-acyltransferase (sialic acid O-acetyltransferase NeuD family)